jgi:plasmid stability protein
MARLIVRNLPADIKKKLRERARRHRRSIEAEVREILRNVVRAAAVPAGPLGTRLRSRFARIGLDADIPEWRGQLVRHVNLSE